MRSPFARAGTIVLAALLVGALASCKPKPTEDGLNRTTPRWVFQATPRPKTAVVFVHGIFGDTLGTWTNADGGTFFDYLRKSPGMDGQFDVFAFGFTSTMFAGGSLDIREAANLLDNELKYSKVWDYDNVVFVAHSMGGLVVLEELSDNRPRLEKVPLLVLYATPQDGAAISAIGQQFGNNPALKQMFPSNSSEFLKALDDNWGKIPTQDRPIVVCAYEKPTHGVLIVTQSSATRFCNGPKFAIGGADHLGIVKPDGPLHDSVKILVNAINDNVLGVSGQPALLEMPDFMPEGDVLVYSMRDLVAPSARLVNNSPRRLRFVVSQPSDPKLLVLPEDTPKFIAAGQRQDLKFRLLMHGTLASEYRFVIGASSAPDRTVVVRVADPAAVQAQQLASVQAVAMDVSKQLAVDSATGRLASLPTEQQLQEVAALARQAVARRDPDLSASAATVLTADVLLAAGWPDLATRALRDVERESPAALELPSVQRLASVASAQSGDARIFVAHPTPAPSSVDWMAIAGAARVTADNAPAWSRLSAQMVRVPALRQYGLVLRGDVLRHEGRTQAADQAYRDAIEIKSTPLFEHKLDLMRPPTDARRDGDAFDFEFRSPALRPDMLAALDETADELRRNPDMTVSVVGYADPEEGTSAESPALSARRARAVESYLVTKGVDAGRIETTGAGEAPAAAVVDRAASRRVVLTTRQ